MTWVIIGLSAGTMFLMAVVLSFVLGWANKKFHVDVDPRVLQIIDELPGANCGGCGYVGCGEYAEAVVGSQQRLHGALGVGHDPDHVAGQVDPVGVQHQAGDGAIGLAG